MNVLLKANLKLPAEFNCVYATLHSPPIKLRDQSITRLGMQEERSAEKREVSGGEQTDGCICVGITSNHW